MLNMQIVFHMSPSLRGSGLKLLQRFWYPLPMSVSLFTREWIEILPDTNNARRERVSLFTREWIEIIFFEKLYWQTDVSLFTREWIEIRCASPAPMEKGSLPLYEGVDWNRQRTYSFPQRDSLPLYEGVDWNSWSVFIASTSESLPLYEGVDWNSFCTMAYHRASVSLFTREWIEILSSLASGSNKVVSPSLRGSGLKYHCQYLHQGRWLSPSLRGSGLKYKKFIYTLAV